MIPPLGLPLILLASASAVAVPPPIGQIGADCQRPVYASDKLVCGDPSLHALDERMRSIGSAVDFGAMLAPDAWVETQVSWFRRRSLCAFSERHAACLRGAYLERIAVLGGLRDLTAAAPRAFARADCAEAAWAGARYAVRVSLPRSASDALVVDDGQGRALAVATRAPADGSWAPHLVFVADGRTVRFERIGGAETTCRLVGAR